MFGGKVKQEQTTKNWPFEFSARPLVEMIGDIGNWIDQPQQFFPGKPYAARTPLEQQALNRLRGGAEALPAVYEQLLGIATPQWEAMLNAPQAVLGRNLTDVYANPALGNVADEIQRRVNMNLQENVLPGLTSSAVTRGALGGTRQQVGEAMAAGRSQEALSGALSNLYGGAWSEALGAETARLGQARATQQAALGATPMLTGLHKENVILPSQILEYVGGMDRAEEQMAIDEEMARHQFAQNEIIDRYTKAYPFIMGPAQAFGSQESKGKAKEKPGLGATIGNIVGMGGSLVGGLGGFGGLGSMIGGPAMGASAGFGLGSLGYGMGYDINPFAQQARMLASQW